MSNADLLALRDRVIPRGVSTANAVVVRETHNASWTDVDGNEWIDFSGGIGTLNVGACNRAVVDAIKKQADKLIHTCSHVAWHEPYIRLAEKLSTLVPIEGPSKVFLCNSGAEAVENAVKIARAATGRQDIVAFSGAFHGRTLMALSLTGKDKPYKNGIGELSDDVIRAEYGNAESVQGILDTHRDKIAAIIVEPVQGEGGFVIPPQNFLSRIAAMAKLAGTLLIADEIQSGMGRTGKLFAVEHLGVHPDMILIGKSIADGLPLAAVAGRTEVMDAPKPGVLGGTYGGNPVACAAALAVLEQFDDGRLLAAAQQLGTHAEQELRHWHTEMPIIGDVRALGAMVALEIVDPLTREPDATTTLEIQQECARNHLVTIRAGIFDNVIRLLFPLTIDNEQLDAGLAILGSALRTINHHQLQPSQAAS